MSDNIVMVSWDSVRADHTPMYGYERNTCPFVNEKSELIFENTHVSAVGTPASFTGVFTGDHASGCQLNPNPGHWKAANNDRTLLPEVLSEAGYHTGAFHFNALMSADFGWNRGWEVYQDGTWAKESNDDERGVKDRSKKFVFDGLQKANLANFAVHFKKMLTRETPVLWEAMWDGIREFLETTPEPWFLWVLLIDTHHPYYVPEEYHEWPQPGIRKTYLWNYLMRRHLNLVGERRESIINAYDNTMRYADDFVRRLSVKLENLGYDNTPFIFHSDHGDEFGEHANYGHRPLMYNTVTRVPLTMWNVGRTGRVEGPNSLLDLGNTVLELAGIEDGVGQRRSLFDERDQITIRNLLGEYGQCAAIVDDNWKVMYHPEGDWGHGGHITPGYIGYAVDDILEEHPSEAYDPEMKTLLRELINQDVRAVDSDEVEVPENLEEQLRDLGYL